MGLPIWRSPSPADSKEPTKSDATTSQQRSTIRRRRSPATSPRSNIHRFAASGSSASGTASRRLPRPLRTFSEVDDHLQSILAESRQSDSGNADRARRNGPLYPPRLAEEYFQMRLRASRHRDRDLDTATQDRETAEPDQPAASSMAEYRTMHLERQRSRMNDLMQSGLVRIEVHGPRDHRDEFEAMRARHLENRRRHQELLDRDPELAMEAYEYNERPETADSPYRASDSVFHNLPPLRGHSTSRPPPEPAFTEHYVTSPRPVHWTEPLDSERPRHLPPRDLTPGAVRPALSSRPMGPETAVPHDFPRLRRMGDRLVSPPLPSSSLRDSWDLPVDGLGDRSRSFSPDADNWDTMLSTIAPDTNLPSADSSFTSAAASASFSASRSHSTDSSSRAHSASSSRTHLTIPSRTEEEEESAEREREAYPCDTDTDSVDPDPELGAADHSDFLVHHLLASRRHHGNLRRRAVDIMQRHDRTQAELRSQIRSLQSEWSPHLAPEPRPALSSRAESELASRPESVFAPEQETTTGLGFEQERESQVDPDLEQIRHILGRLAQRDDIPDEQWARVGLTPSLARELGLFRGGRV